MQFERLSSKRGEVSGEFGEDQALAAGQFKGKCQNCGKMGHKAAKCFLKKGQQDKSSIVCYHCKKPGHTKFECFKLKRKQSEENKDSSENGANVLLMSLADTALSAHTWIGDSGASGHYCNSLEGMYDMASINDNIKVSNGKTIKATKLEKLNCKVFQ